MLEMGILRLRAFPENLGADSSEQPPESTSQKGRAEGGEQARIILDRTMKEDCSTLVGKLRGKVMKKEPVPTMHEAPSKRGIAHLLDCREYKSLASYFIFGVLSRPCPIIVNRGQKGNLRQL